MTQHIPFPRHVALAIILSLLGLSLSAQTPKAVDLGLSVKWADRNLGANTPEQEGDPYAWGELKTKSAEFFIPKKRYKSANETFDELIDPISYQVKPHLYRLRKEFDMCSASLGDGWRLPTAAEWNEMMKKCNFEWIKGNGLNMVKVTGPNGNYITIPVAGQYYPDLRKQTFKSKREEKNQIARYWSSDANYRKGIYATGMYKVNREVSANLWDFSNPWNGYFVRAVYDPTLINDNDNNDDKRIDPKPDPKPNPDPIVNSSRPELTVIGWSESTHSPKITLKVGVKSKTAITGSTVTVNGQQTRGIKAVNNDGYDMMIRQEITLREGTNTVKVEVTNGAGTSSKTAQVFYMPVVEDDKKEVVQQLRKVAYVVGNSAYPGNELPNPKNDATDISAKLRSLGFEVITLIDGTRRQIEDGISTFSRKAADADVAMFFYAGHGIQYNGANYLIPVDAVLRSAKDIDYECTDVNRLLANMEESGCKMNIIALDACRNNPFERGWYRGSSSKGLSAINAPIGTFISYATSPGSVAADGTTRNSPYTSALLKALDRPGLTIEGVFKNVGAEVVKATNRNQTPWYSSSIYQGEFIFNPSE